MAMERLNSKVKLTEFAGILTDSEANNLKEKIKMAREISTLHIKKIKRKY